MNIHSAWDKHKFLSVADTPIIRVLGMKADLQYEQVRLNQAMCPIYI